MKLQYLVPTYIKCASIEERKEIQTSLEEIGYKMFPLCEVFGNGFLSIATHGNGEYFLIDGNRENNYDCTGNKEIFIALSAVTDFDDYFVYIQDIRDECSDYIIHRKGQIFKSCDREISNAIKANKEDIIKFFTS